MALVISGVFVTQSKGSKAKEHGLPFAGPRGRSILVEPCGKIICMAKADGIRFHWRDELRKLATAKAVTSF